MMHSTEFLNNRLMSVVQCQWTMAWITRDQHEQITTVQTTLHYYRLQPFVCDHPDEPVLEETFTHSWSSTILYQPPPSTTIHSIHPVQLQSFLHNLSPEWRNYHQCCFELCFGSLHAVNWHCIETLQQTHAPLTSQSLLSITDTIQLLLISTPLTPLTGRAIKPQHQGHVGGPIMQPWVCVCVCLCVCVMCR